MSYAEHPARSVASKYGDLRYHGPQLSVVCSGSGMDDPPPVGRRSLDEAQRALRCDVEQVEASRLESEADLIAWLHRRVGVGEHGEAQILGGHHADQRLASEHLDELGAAGDRPEEPIALAPEPGVLGAD